ncbi:MAG: type II toxin-antitoxin system RelE/ParE family toxin [Planctomycetes bacterium]|nr:type II toxin-antitoxin system RelE/ParE family toxin [Planctomycetota bacterium]
MSPHARWTPEAGQDLEDIVSYIALKEGRLSTAESVADEIHEKCETYSKFPTLGTARPDLGPGYRVFTVKRWVIIFRPVDQQIEVMRVVDGARDYGRLFP